MYAYVCVCFIENHSEPAALQTSSEQQNETENQLNTTEQITGIDERVSCVVKCMTLLLLEMVFVLVKGQLIRGFYSGFA